MAAILIVIASDAALNSDLSFSNLSECWLIMALHAFCWTADSLSSGKDLIKFGEPAQAVTKEKQHTIKKVARHYLKSKEIEDIDCRFDVVQIVDEELTHYKNAF